MGGLWYSIVIIYIFFLSGLVLYSDIDEGWLGVIIPVFLYIVAQAEMDNDNLKRELRQVKKQ